MALIRFWIVRHDADLTETGDLRAQTYLKTVWEGFPYQQSCEIEIIRDWCRERFGPEVVYVQGVAAALNWSINESTEEEFENEGPIMLGGYKMKSKQVVIGIGDHGKIITYADVEV